LAFVAILSPHGRFGGLRTANVSYFATRGLTGVYAPGVAFDGPVYVGNINAADTAAPVLVTGSVSDIRITGGDLAQDNGQPVQIGGFSSLRFTDGSTSHGDTQPAQPL